MYDENENKVEEICQRIQNLITGDLHTDDEKLSFVRKALAIIDANKEAAQ